MMMVIMIVIGNVAFLISFLVYLQIRIIKFSRASISLTSNLEIIVKSSLWDQGRYDG